MFNACKCALPLSSYFHPDRFKPVETGIFILGVSARRAPRKIWTMHPPTGRLIGCWGDDVAVSQKGRSRHLAPLVTSSSRASNPGLKQTRTF